MDVTEWAGQGGVVLERMEEMGGSPQGRGSPQGGGGPARGLDGGYSSCTGTGLKEPVCGAVGDPVCGW